jgi:hypothetical protein
MKKERALFGDDQELCGPIIEGVCSPLHRGKGYEMCVFSNSNWSARSTMSLSYMVSYMF